MTASHQIFLVAIGSALGGLSRWGVTLLFGRWLGTGFPWGTLAVNLSGSFVLGWLVMFVKGRHALPITPNDLQLLVGVGFCGAYTTFSTFALENQKLLSASETLTSAAYVAGSVFFGILAVRAGMWLGSTNVGA